MITFVPMATALSFASANLEEFRVVSVERHFSFAGKLGSRVHETLVAEKDGARVKIRVGAYHTRFFNAPEPIEPGDLVVVFGAPEASEFAVSRSQIVRRS